MHKYEVIIYWSSEDEVFVAEVPQLAGCVAHGPSPQAALQSSQEAIDLWIETAEKHGRTVPKSKGRRLRFA